MYTSMRIVGADDAPLGAHEIGEILLRSPMVMTEYRNRPDETAAALAGGWLHTGDMGLVDEDGFLHVVDRQKDMFISGGINVYPAEIERVLAGLPGLEELAVVGIPDQKWGEVPLLVVADLTAVDLDAIAGRCVEQLADYKRPKLVVSHGGPLPRGMSGKVQKRELADRYREPGADAVPVRRAATTSPPPG
jgi:fatty-acyl-CoA synthase